MAEPEPISEFQPHTPASVIGSDMGMRPNQTLQGDFFCLELLGKRLVFLLLPSCYLGRLQADANTAGNQSQEGKRNRVTMVMFEY